MNLKQRPTKVVSLRKVLGDKIVSDMPPCPKVDRKDLPYNNVLTQEQKLKIVDLIAQGVSKDQIVNHIEEEIGIRLAFTAIYSIQHAKKWQGELERRRIHYRSKIELLDTSHKYSRIKRMEDIFDRAIKQDNLPVAISAIEHVRREMEKDGESTSYIQNNLIIQQYAKLSDDELLTRYNEASKKMRAKQKESLNGPSGQTGENSGERSVVQATETN